MWPVKPMKRILPAFFAASSASMAPPCAKMRSGSFVADDLVDLQQVDVVGLEPLQRLVDLLRRPSSRSRPSIFVIRKALLPVAVAQRLAHADLALAVVVVPAVVEEVDAAVERACG